MIKFILPNKNNKEDVLAFYDEIEKNGDECIGFKNHSNYDKWLIEMQNRHLGENLPKGYVKENFYLCYDENKLIGVFSLKFELTEYLLNYGGHIGYATLPSQRRKGYATNMLKEGLKIAKKLGFNKVLCVCDDDNIGSEKVIIKNNGILKNTLFDPAENVTVKRFWIDL